MKLGDNIDKAGKALATMERLWGFGKETRDIASGRMKIQKGDKQLLEVVPSETRMKSTPATPQALKKFQQYMNKRNMNIQKSR